MVGKNSKVYFDIRIWCVIFAVNNVWMADDQNILVQDLVERVHRLMDRYREAKTRIEVLETENGDLNRRLIEQKNRIENLEQQYNTAKIATNVLAPLEDKEEARGQLNRIVREIDNCIALLNR